MSPWRVVCIPCAMLTHIFALKAPPCQQTVVVDECALLHPSVHSAERMPPALIRGCVQQFVTAMRANSPLRPTRTISTPLPWPLTLHTSHLLLGIVLSLSQTHTHSHTHTHSLTHSLTPSLTHSHTHSCACPLVLLCRSWRCCQTLCCRSCRKISRPRCVTSRRSFTAWSRSSSSSSSSSRSSSSCKPSGYAPEATCACVYACVCAFFCR